MYVSGFLCVSKQKWCVIWHPRRPSGWYTGDYKSVTWPRLVTDAFRVPKAPQSLIRLLHFCPIPVHYRSLSISIVCLCRLPRVQHISFFWPFTAPLTPIDPHLKLDNYRKKSYKEISGKLNTTSARRPDAKGARASDQGPKWDQNSPDSWLYVCSLFFSLSHYWLLLAYYKYVYIRFLIL